jgi:cytochrome c peroxidase
MPNYMNARTDVGFYAVSKDSRDIGKFQTAQLRDLKYTAPYMHNGVFATLEEVVDFYDRGGGAGSVLKPLKLTSAEKQALTAFLLTLSGDPIVVKDPGQPEMKVRANYGKN